MFENIYGNCVTKNLEFQHVVESVFGHKKLCDLITLVHEESVSAINAKKIMHMIIDGDERMPSQIAAEVGMIGKVEIGKELIGQVRECIKEH